MSTFLGDVVKVKVNPPIVRPYFDPGPNYHDLLARGVKPDCKPSDYAFEYESIAPGVLSNVEWSAQTGKPIQAFNVYGVVTYYQKILKMDGSIARHRIRMRSIVPFDHPFYNSPINKEPDMRVFEAIVIRLDEQEPAQPAEVVKNVGFVLAKDAADARTAVLVDYAAEAKIAGKDAARFQVRVREFSFQ